MKKVNYGIVIFVLATAIILLIGVYGQGRFENFKETGNSMEPTFKKGDILVVDKYIYKRKKPKREDLIVFRYPKDVEKIFHKRIIAIESDKIEIRNGTVFLNGVELKEKYAIRNILTNMESIIVPKDSVFVLGDNRKSSFDSSNWGCLPNEYMIGKIIKIKFPFKRVRFLNN